MPRTARASVGGVCYHVLNRGNGRAKVFRKPRTIAAFLDLIAEANERLPLRVLGYCPDAQPLSSWCFGLMATAISAAGCSGCSPPTCGGITVITSGSGHVWQGRFKAFPIQQDEHLLTVLRYVERNPLRARWSRGRSWPWSSLGASAAHQRPGWLVEGPVDLPA